MIGVIFFIKKAEKKYLFYKIHLYIHEGFWAAGARVLDHKLFKKNFISAFNQTINIMCIVSNHHKRFYYPFLILFVSSMQVPSLVSSQGGTPGKDSKVKADVTIKEGEGKTKEGSGFFPYAYKLGAYAYYLGASAYYLGASTYQAAKVTMMGPEERGDFHREIYAGIRSHHGYGVRVGYVKALNTFIRSSDREKGERLVALLELFRNEKDISEMDSYSLEDFRMLYDSIELYEKRGDFYHVICSFIRRYRGDDERGGYIKELSAFIRSSKQEKELEEGLVALLDFFRNEKKLSAMDSYSLADFQALHSYIEGYEEKHPFTSPDAQHSEEVIPLKKRLYVDVDARIGKIKQRGQNGEDYIERSKDEEEEEKRSSDNEEKITYSPTKAPTFPNSEDNHEENEYDVYSPEQEGSQSEKSEWKRSFAVVVIGVAGGGALVLFRNNRKRLNKRNGRSF